MASTNLTAEEAQDLRALSFISGDNVSTILKRLIRKEIEANRDAINKMTEFAEESRALKKVGSSQKG